MIVSNVTWNVTPDDATLVLSILYDIVGMTLGLDYLCRETMMKGKRNEGLEVSTLFRSRCVELLLSSLWLSSLTLSQQKLVNPRTFCMSGDVGNWVWFEQIPKTIKFQEDIII
jgi:hypothetical protein